MRVLNPTIISRRGVYDAVSTLNCIDLIIAILVIFWRSKHFIIYKQILLVEFFIFVPLMFTVANL